MSTSYARSKGIDRNAVLMGFGLALGIPMAALIMAGGVVSVIIDEIVWWKSKKIRTPQVSTDPKDIAQINKKHATATGIVALVTGILTFVLPIVWGAWIVSVVCGLLFLVTIVVGIVTFSRGVE